MGKNMYVEHMNAQELRNEYDKDYQELFRKLPYRIGEWRRLALKRNKFPWEFTFEITTNQGNLCIVRVLLSQKKDLSNYIGFVVRVFGCLKTDSGIAIIDDNDYQLGMKSVSVDGIFSASLRVYRPHLLSRYSERFGLDPLYKNKYHQFILRNDYLYCCACEFEGIHGAKYDTLGIIKDGAIYGSTDTLTNVLYFHTFLRTDQLKNKQLHYLGEISRHYLEHQKVFDLIEPNNVKYCCQR